MKLDPKVPTGPIEKRWSQHKFDMKLVNPANRRKYTVIVVGTGLAGSSAAASLAELGFNVEAFSFHESPRRAHSIAAQGGINAAKNYVNDGDSVWRLFHDTVKGGDYRARESNVYRLAEVSGNIIDQCVAQGVPFAREYGGSLDTRSFGGAQLSRTFYARGQTGQQLLLGAYSALSRNIHNGGVTFHGRKEMLDLVVVDGKARGIVVRDLLTGEISTHLANAVILATGGYGNVFYLSTNALACNTSAIMKAWRKGAYLANPCYTQIHPTCIPVAGDYQSKLTLMSESLRNDGRVWVPKKKGDNRNPAEIPEEERDYYLERLYPSFGNLVPRDVASRRAKDMCDKGLGVGKTGLSVYLDFADAIKRNGEEWMAEKYGNLMDMYQEITDENPYKQPMRIYPAVHYTMGGLWVDYHLQSTIPGLFVAGEANFSDHGANRLGASALMQGLADGYFVLPYTVSDYLAGTKFEAVKADAPEVAASAKEAKTGVDKLMNVNGKTPADIFHRRLGHVMWEKVGMAREKKGLEEAIAEIRNIRKDFWKDLKVSGQANDLNSEIERAGRVADFIDLGELLATDALHREESCGGHFRLEHQTDEGETKRDDQNFAYAAAWQYAGEGQAPVLNKDELTFEYDIPSSRSYK
ncbi:MAG TPA: fumarate reductase/succinate dehydrogenase flavoprotein subunit [Rectinemataceae bacterium]|nr:fumarate reductase/succinate dehydrogenase flavoprotein subunit [Rectinemataceae bacterium]